MEDMNSVPFAIEVMEKVQPMGDCGGCEGGAGGHGGSSGPLLEELEKQMNE